MSGEPDPGARADAEAPADEVRTCRDHRTHGCKRNGTTFLLAALDVATGKVVGRTVGRHRSEEFLAFLDHVAEGIEPGIPVHVIFDNVSSHKSAEVREWLKGRPDWTTTSHRPRPPG